VAGFLGENRLAILLEGKRAFVSGGTRGIGAAICEVFAREGADVAFNYNSREDLAQETSRRVESFGRRSLSFKVSVTDRVGMKRLTREIVERWGGVDILVNNAAINRGDNFATPRTERGVVLSLPTATISSVVQNRFTSR